MFHTIQMDLFAYQKSPSNSLSMQILFHVLVADSFLKIKFWIAAKMDMIGDQNGQGFSTKRPNPNLVDFDSLDGYQIYTKVYCEVLAWSLFLLFSKF